MDEDDRRRPQVDGAADHLADVDGGLVERAAAHHFVADQHVAGVEVEDAEAFDGAVRHVGVEIVEQRLPVGEHRPLGDLAADHPDRGCLRDLDRGGGVVSDPVDAA